MFSRTGLCKKIPVFNGTSNDDSAAGLEFDFSFKIWYFRPGFTINSLVYDARINDIEQSVSYGGVGWKLGLEIPLGKRFFLFADYHQKKLTTDDFDTNILAPGMIEGTRNIKQIKIGIRFNFLTVTNPWAAKYEFK